MVAAANRDARSRDDELFTKVLSSAYSLQQQHDRIQAKLPAARLSEILAEVVNTQALIRTRQLDCDTAMHLIASRTEKLSGGAGAAIALLDGENLDYRVGTGIAATLCGFKCRAREVTSFERLKSDALAETDTWQEKVLGGRVVANVLSAPIYRQNTLAGCVQLFSRHGHFDFDGRYVCELMAGVVSHVIDKAPPSKRDAKEEQTGAEKVEPALAREHENPLASDSQKPAIRPKLEWPGSSTRELEAKLKKTALSANAEDKSPQESRGPESHKISHQSVNAWEDRANDVEIQAFGDSEDGNDRNPQIVSRASRGPAPSHGSLALVHSESHAPHLVANPGGVTDRSPKDKAHDQGGRRETLREISALVVSAEQAGAQASSERANQEPGISGSKTWHRVKRMIYPIFVLLFAIGVRIRAGAHNWPLEVIIYIILVLTTLELQSRWSRR